MVLIVLSGAASYVRDRVGAIGWIQRYALSSRSVIIEPGIGSGSQAPVATIASSSAPQPAHVHMQCLVQA